MLKRLSVVLGFLCLLSPSLGAQETPWRLVAGADGDGAWVAVTGHWDDEGGLDERLDDPALSCRWTVQVGDVSYTVDDAYLIPEEGICVLQTVDALPDLVFPPAGGMTVSLQILRNVDEVFVSLPPRTLSWDPATLVSTRAIRAELGVAGWEVRVAEQVPSWGEGHRWLGLSLERDQTSCLLEFQVGDMAGRPLPEGVPPESVAMGLNHQIQVAQCTEPAEVRPRGYEITERPDIQLELVSLLTGLIRPASPQSPASQPSSLPHVP